MILTPRIIWRRRARRIAGSPEGGGGISLSAASEIRFGVWTIAIGSPSYAPSPRLV